ncbi:MAG: hypothetical protein FWD66_00960 [Paludibacter sp.]|nr:hypothetical protein [Paludibacter sp.]
MDTINLCEKGTTTQPMYIEIAEKMANEIIDRFDIREQNEAIIAILEITKNSRMQYIQTTTEKLEGLKNSFNHLQEIINNLWKQEN